MAYRLQCPCWAPSRFQDVQADFPSLQRQCYSQSTPKLLLCCGAYCSVLCRADMYLEMNVWVENFGLETHIWSYQRILLRHLENNLKNTTLKRCVFWTLQHEHSITALLLPKIEASQLERRCIPAKSLSTRICCFRQVSAQCLYRPLKAWRPP